MIQVPENLRGDFTLWMLGLADDKLVLGHRIADWTGLAPILEEDIAFSSISQDELAHALILYEQIGMLTGRSADAVAYARPMEEYRCARIVELEDDLQWDVAIVRQFFCDHAHLGILKGLGGSSDAELAALASRLAAEERIHVEHADHWMTLLGQAGGEASRRTQGALARLAPEACMLFEPTPGAQRVIASGLVGEQGGVFDLWREEILQVCHAAGFSLRLDTPSPSARGGRNGRHSPVFDALIDELTEVYRLEPEASW